MNSTSSDFYQAYFNILKEELISAMGCTEPIAVAYAGAKAVDALGMIPDRVVVKASDNIIKNVKSVVVPNTGNLCGIDAAVAAGIIAGKSERVLDVIAAVTDTQKQNIKSFVDSGSIEVASLDSNVTFDLIVHVFKGNIEVTVQISHYHTNIVKITRNGTVLFENQACDDIPAASNLTDRSILNVQNIVDFAMNSDISEVQKLLEQQIEYNSAIADEGMRGDWGANVGSVIQEIWGNDIKTRVKARTAAASDARMSGCALPVMIVSGSGNQGLTASLPVIEFAKELNVDHETLLRALVVANLVTIHQKTGIGRLSAYCGVVSAGAGAGAGITFLHGGGFREIAHTIVNTLATVSGIICDGAKPSCAGKIAAAVDAAMLGFFMFQKGQQFYGGDGIVRKGVENTINNIGRLGRVGMRETDKEIINMMLEK